MSRCASRWQVILLHGPSGTGKTATVEAIAEHFRRPLYSLAVCSLPLDITLLVDTLTSRLDAARSWNAIVLIEAGDILMQTQRHEPIVRISCLRLVPSRPAIRWKNMFASRRYSSSLSSIGALYLLPRGLRVLHTCRILL
ncbi:hypothetical protein BDR07DRAFT_1418946 [Suillus spraguei]|nr:hypothetical protein BDR07DRAFT_1418946 [Suillus spraguei]